MPHTDSKFGFIQINKNADFIHLEYMHVFYLYIKYTYFTVSRFLFVLITAAYRFPVTINQRSLSMLSWPLPELLAKCVMCRKELEPG